MLWFKLRSSLIGKQGDRRMTEHDAIIFIAGTAWLLPLLRAALHPINTDDRKED